MAKPQSEPLVMRISNGDFQQEYGITYAALRLQMIEPRGICFGKAGYQFKDSQWRKTVKKASLLKIQHSCQVCNLPFAILCDN